MREMEKQQREMEETSDRHYELLNSGTGSALIPGSGMGSTSLNSFDGNSPFYGRSRITPTLIGSRDVSFHFLIFSLFDFLSLFRGHFQVSFWVIGGILHKNSFSFYYSISSIFFYFPHNNILFLLLL